MKIKLLGSELTKSISSKEPFVPSRVYHLAPVRLLKIACPREIKASQANMRMVPIVVEKNRKLYGKVPATGWTPEAVVVAGAATRHAMLDVGVLEAMAWVESGLKINADDAVSCAELAENLQAELTYKFYGSAGPGVNQPYPWIAAIYPFENQMVYGMTGQIYRQPYALNPVDRIVALAGPAVKIDAAGEMPKVETGLRQVSNPYPLSPFQVSWRSGATSELMTQVIRDMSNVNGVVSRLQAMIRNGVLEPMIPDFCPVALSSDHKILRPFIKAGIAPVDVVRGMELLEAGGPGSGPRPGYGRGAQPGFGEGHKDMAVVPGIKQRFNDWSKSNMGQPKMTTPFANIINRRQRTDVAADVAAEKSRSSRGGKTAPGRVRI